MPIAAGSKLGPSGILAPIGAGGMGKVYRARDTTLKRDVDPLMESAADGSKRPDNRIGTQIINIENEHRLIMRAIQSRPSCSCNTSGRSLPRADRNARHSALCSAARKMRAPASSPSRSTQPKDPDASPDPSSAPCAYKKDASDRSQVTCCKSFLPRVPARIQWLALASSRYR